VKCDACKDNAGGAACVRACPTGAAMRLNPKDFVDLVGSRFGS
jgi:Fe-S-cluster-containing hydrogenase component 2